MLLIWAGSNCLLNNGRCSGKHVWKQTLYLSIHLVMAVTQKLDTSAFKWYLLILRHWAGHSCGLVSFCDLSWWGMRWEIRYSLLKSENFLTVIPITHLASALCNSVWRQIPEWLWLIQADLKNTFLLFVPLFLLLLQHLVFFVTSKHLLSLLSSSIYIC